MLYRPVRWRRRSIASSWRRRTASKCSSRDMPEFDSSIRLEKNGTELQKQAKAYLEAMRAMTASQVRIADTIDRFYGDNSEAAMAATSYKRAVDDMDSRTTRELVRQ